MEFPQWVRDRVVARQGRLHPYDELPAARLAVVVIDMQQYFTLPGYQGECAPARGLIGPINRLHAVARPPPAARAGWVQTASVLPTQVCVRTTNVMLDARTQRETPGDRCAAISPGFALHPARGLTIPTCGWSALSTATMAHGIVGAAAAARARRGHAAGIAGTVTGVCCESTARDDDGGFPQHRGR